jgi:drug/metabolite transporter (DMT)-like permease
LNEGAQAANPLRGIGLKVASVIGFVGMSSLIKSAGSLPPGQLVFFRSFFAIFPIVLILAWRSELRGALRTSQPLGHVIRGGVGVVSMGLGFYALTLLPLPEWIAIGYAQPLIIVLIGALFMGETVRMFRWGAVIVGFLGVLVISWPKLTLLTSAEGLQRTQAVGVLICLASAAVSAVALTYVRILVRTERTPTVVLWFSLTASTAALMTLPFGWASLSPGQAAALIGAGFCGGVAQMLMTEAYRHAELSTVAPFEYVSLLLGVVIGFFAFGEAPSAYVLVGGTIVIAAGLVIIWREHRLNIDRMKLKPLAPPQ